MNGSAVSSTTREKLWEIVAGHREGVLGTIGDDGLAHLSNVDYVPDAQRAPVIRISTTATRTKGRYQTRGARAVLPVPGPNFFRRPGGRRTVGGVQGLQRRGRTDHVRPEDDQRPSDDRAHRGHELYGLVHRGERRPRRPEDAGNADSLGHRR